MVLPTNGTYILFGYFEWTISASNGYNIGIISPNGAGQVVRSKMDGGGGAIICGLYDRLGTYSLQAYQSTGSATSVQAIQFFALRIA